jgi:hypothetical protein
VNKGKKSPSELSALDKAVDAAMAGASCGSVQKLTGVPRSTVRYHVLQRGIARRSIPRSGPKLRAEADIDKALAAVAAGVSWRNAAECARSLNFAFCNHRNLRSAITEIRVLYSTKVALS